jgi:hypothetical protein
MGIRSNGGSGRLSLRLLPRRAGKTARALASSTQVPALRVSCREVERFVFCASTGRSGTQTLSSVLAAGGGVASFHEPFPILRAPVLRAAAAGRQTPVRLAWRHLKLPTVLRAASDHRIYAETNHQFVKVFGDLAYEEFGPRLTVIHLKRDRLAVARSMYELGQFPGTRNGARWLLDPDAPTNRVPFAIAAERGLTHPLHRCLWYCLETEWRAADAHRSFAGCTWVELELEELNSKEGLARLDDALDLRLSPGFIEGGTRRLNAKPRELRLQRRLPREQAALLYAEFVDAYADWIPAEAESASMAGAR